jgi:chromosome segregation ATPase
MFEGYVLDCVIIVFFPVQAEIGLEAVADLEFRVKQLNDDIQMAESQKYKEIETLRTEKDRNIGELQEENAKLTIQVEKLLEQQERQKEENVLLQIEKLNNKKKAQEETRGHQVEVAELEMLQKELGSMQREVEKLRNEIKAAKDRYTNDMEVIKTEHERVLTELQHKTKETFRKKESEAELWQKKNKQMEKEIAELHKELEEQTKKFEDDKDTCALPEGPIKDEIKNELEEALVRLEENKGELAMKDKEVDRLARELEVAEVKHTEELRTELEKRDIHHADEVGHLKANFEEKQKHDEELVKQEMQKKMDQRELVNKDRRLALKNENEILKEKLKQKDHELKTCVDSVKTISVQRHERQLKEKTEEIKSLSDQLIEARSQQQKVNNEIKKLQQKLIQRESEIAAARENYDKLFSDHKQLQSDHEQLEVMIKLRKHEEASAAATTNWIHSSEDDVESEVSHVSVLCHHYVIIEEPKRFPIAITFTYN